MTTTLTKRDIAAMEEAGQVANQYASEGVFADYRSRKSDNTLRAQHIDLSVWADYLSAATSGAHAPAIETLETDAGAWRGVTWGLVAGFVQWMLQHGYAMGSVNRQLATVRTYCKLAAQAGVIDATQAALITTVRGYNGMDAKRIDERRESTRRGAKKAAHVSLTVDQVRALKTHPDTPQGRRDALLMCLLLDHGLRVGEVALLTVDAFYSDESGTFTFYRPKVGKQQKHRLSDDTLRALTRYFEHDAPARGRLLFRPSAKGGQLKTGAGISERNLSERVRTIGRRIGIENLSAHDCRHSWATRAVAAGTNAFALRDAGGWASLAMPSRYVEAAAVANERVTLG
jgi:integrase